MKYRILNNESLYISTLNKFTLVVAIVFFSYDIIVDFYTEGGTFHIYIELVIFILVSLSLSWEIIHRIRAKKQLIESERKLSLVTTTLAEQVKSQLDNWKLTDTEKEVAWLIIKGFSFSEIATLRNVKDKTARTQASMIYSKARVNGRAEFTALFLDDFLHQPDPSLK